MFDAQTGSGSIRVPRVAFGVPPNASSRRKICQPEGLPEMSRGQRPRCQPPGVLRPGGALEHSSKHLPAHASVCQRNQAFPQNLNLTLNTQNPMDLLTNPQKIPRKTPPKNCKFCAKIKPTPHPANLCFFGKKFARVSVQTSNGTRERARSPSINKSALFCAICDLLPSPNTTRVTGITYKFRIRKNAQNFSFKTSWRSSTCESPPQVNKGNWAQKNSEFFSGHFYRKPLANQQKMAKKTAQNHAKKSRFLMRFLPRQLLNKSQRPSFKMVNLTSIIYDFCTKNGTNYGSYPLKADPPDKVNMKLSFYSARPRRIVTMPALERLKKYCGHSAARNFGFWQGLSEGACPKRPVTERKRRQNPKEPLPLSFPPDGCSIFENALKRRHAATRPLSKTTTRRVLPGEEMVGLSMCYQLLIVIAKTTMCRENNKPEPFHCARFP